MVFPYTQHTFLQTIPIHSGLYSFKYSPPDDITFRNLSDMSDLIKIYHVILSDICHMLYILRSIIGYPGSLLENISDSPQTDTQTTTESTNFIK